MGLNLVLLKQVYDGYWAEEVIVDNQDAGLRVFVQKALWDNFGVFAIIATL